MPTKSRLARSQEHKDSETDVQSPVDVSARQTTAAPTAMTHDYSAISVAPSVQRQFAASDKFEPAMKPDPNILPGHKAGDDWWSLAHYGAFGGPGSLHGMDKPAIDGMDEVFRQHDANYGRAGVSADSMWSIDTLLKSRDADRLLYEGVDQEMDTNGGAYSSSARLFGQGAKGLFGARSGVADGYMWGDRKAGELANGVSGAYNDATGWLGNRGGEIANGVGGAYNDATGWLGGKGSEAANGIGGFFNEASQWDSFGDVAGGLMGGAQQAGSWLGDTFSQAKNGIGGAFGDATGWLGNTANSAMGGIGEAAGSAFDWTMNTGMEAAGGLGSAASGIGGWLGDTAGAVGDVALDKGKDALGGIGDLVSSWF